MELTERRSRVRNLFFAVTGGILLPVVYIFVVPYVAKLATWLVPSVQLDVVLMFPLVGPCPCTIGFSLLPRCPQTSYPVVIFPGLKH